MLRTIQIGTCAWVQGLLVKTLENGRIIVSVGNRTFEGVPVSK